MRSLLLLLFVVVGCQQPPPSLELYQDTGYGNVVYISIDGGTRIVRLYDSDCQVEERWKSYGRGAGGGWYYWSQTCPESSDLGLVKFGT